LFEKAGKNAIYIFFGLINQTKRGSLKTEVPGEYSELLSTYGVTGRFAVPTLPGVNVNTANVLFSLLWVQLFCCCVEVYTVNVHTLRATLAS